MSYIENFEKQMLGLEQILISRVLAEIFFLLCVKGASVFTILSLVPTKKLEGNT